MLKILHLKNSRSHRIVWLSEELGLTYAVEIFDWAPGHQLSERYRALHPVARAPLIEDGDVMLGESGAIIEYLISRYGNGRLRPEISSPDYPDYLFWLHFAEGSLIQFIQVFRAADAANPTNEMGERARRRLKEDLAFADETLGRKPYFAGDALSGADINMHLALNLAQHITKWDFSNYPNLAEYLNRIAQRPAYKKARLLD
jgi:glutathione S-transferase